MAKRRRPRTPYLRANRDGTLIIHWYDEHGHKREHSTATNDYLAADALLTDFKGKRKHLHAKGRDLTWEMAARQWYEEVGKPTNVAWSLKATIGALWRISIIDLDAPLPVGALGLKTIAGTSLEWMEQFWQRLQAHPKSVQRYQLRGRRKAVDRLSNSMVGQLQDFIKAILRHAIAKQRIDAAWCPFAKRVGKDERRPEFWDVVDKDRIEQAIEAASHTRDGPAAGPPSRLLLYWTIALGSGIRKDRILNAKWDLVDWQQQTIDFTRVHSPPESRHQPDLAHGTNKPGHVYHFDGDPDMLAMLQWAYQYRTPDDYILRTKGDIYNELKAVLATLGLEGSPHIIKHTMVTILLQAGVPIAKVSEMTGTSVATLLKVYKHLIPTDHGQIAATSLRRRRVPAGVSILPTAKRRR